MKNHIKIEFYINGTIFENRFEIEDDIGGLWRKINNYVIEHMFPIILSNFIKKNEKKSNKNIKK